MVSTSCYSTDKIRLQSPVLKKKHPAPKSQVLVCMGMEIGHSLKRQIRTLEVKVL